MHIREEKASSRIDSRESCIVLEEQLSGGEGSPMQTGWPITFYSPKSLVQGGIAGFVNESHIGCEWRDLGAYNKEFDSLHLIASLLGWI